MSGERIAAQTAEAWGLVEFVVDDLEEGIERYVAPLAGSRPARDPADQAALPRHARRAQRRAGGRGVRRVPRVRGRAGGRRRVPREAPGALDGAVSEGRRPARGRRRPRGRGRAPSPYRDVVVDVRAAGVNFADVLIRRGLYPQMPELPHVLGNEVAGELDGQRVLALPRAAGGYAERVEVDPQWTFPLPDNASFAAGRLVPDDVPDRVHPAAAAGARHAGVDGARARRLRRRRLRGDPAREAPRREGDRDGDRATRSARSRATPGPTRRSATTRSTTCASTSSSTRSAATCSRARCRCSTRSARSSRSASRAGCGPIRACSGSSGATRPSSASTSAG